MTHIIFANWHIVNDRDYYTHHLIASNSSVGTSKEMKDVTVSKGNVFEDMGLSEPADRLAKAELARKIAEIISKHRLNQIEAARLLGVDQPKIFAIMNGRLAGFALERLFQFLNIMGRDVQIVVRLKSRSGKKAGLMVICP